MSISQIKAVPLYKENEVSDTQTVNPTTEAQTIVPDPTLKAMKSVEVLPVTSAIDGNIQANNIKEGVTILGVEGTYTPPAPKLQTKTVTENNIIVKPDENYDGLGQVNVAIPYTYDQSKFKNFQESADDEIYLYEPSTSGVVVFPTVYNGENVVKTQHAWVDPEDWEDKLLGCIFPKSEYFTTIGSKSMGNNVLDVINTTQFIYIPKNVQILEQQAFYKLGQLRVIIYEGTMEEWKAISKEKGSYAWNSNTGEYVIVCSDGVYNKNEEIIQGLNTLKSVEYYTTSDLYYVDKMLTSSEIEYPEYTIPFKGFARYNKKDNIYSIILPIEITENNTTYNADTLFYNPNDESGKQFYWIGDSGLSNKTFFYSDIRNIAGVHPSDARIQPINTESKSMADWIKIVFGVNLYSTHQAVVIGFKGLTNESGELTWTDSIEDFTSYSAVDSTTNYQGQLHNIVTVTSPLDNVFPYNKISKSSYDKNIYISFPAMYISWVLDEDDNIDGIRISNVKVNESFFVPECFKNSAENSIDKYIDGYNMYIGVYEGSVSDDDKLQSQSNATIRDKETIDNFRSFANNVLAFNNNVRPQLLDLSQVTIYNFLVMLYYKTSNIQNVFTGIDTYGKYQTTTGITDIIKGFNGWDKDTGAVKMLGIENPYGNASKFIDGVTFDKGKIIIQRSSLDYGTENNKVELDFERSKLNNYRPSKLRADLRKDLQSYAFVSDCYNSVNWAGAFGDLYKYDTTSSVGQGDDSKTGKYLSLEGWQTYTSYTGLWSFNGSNDGSGSLGLGARLSARVYAPEKE